MSQSPAAGYSLLSLSYHSWSLMVTFHVSLYSETLEIKKFENLQSGTSIITNSASHSYFFYFKTFNGLIQWISHLPPRWDTLYKDFIPPWDLTFWPHKPDGRRYSSHAQHTALGTRKQLMFPRNFVIILILCFCCRSFCLLGDPWIHPNPSRPSRRRSGPLIFTRNKLSLSFVLIH